jgi:putative acetyltransferase
MNRQAETADLEFFYRLYMHPAVNPFLLYEYMDAEAFAPIFEDLLRQKVLYVFEYAGQSAGMFKLIPLTHRTSHVAYLGGFAVDPDFAGRGLGTLMLQDVLKLGQSRGFKRLELSAAVGNERAIQLYEKMGFEREGILRQYTWLKSEGRILDEVLMAYLYK